MSDKALVNSKVENIYSLTPLQEGMLFHNLYNKNSTDYVLQNILSVDYDLSTENVKTALRLLSKRFSVLRTLFFYQKIDKPQQIVLKDRKIEYEIIDLSSSTSNCLKKEINKIIKDDLHRNFDLQFDSLLRLNMIKMPDHKSKLIWTMHHIIVDGWCTGKLFKKFFEYYSRLCNGESEEDILNEINSELISSASFSDYTSLPLARSNGLRNSVISSSSDSLLVVYSKSAST